MAYFIVDISCHLEYFFQILKLKALIFVKSSREDIISIRYIGSSVGSKPLVSQIACYDVIYKRKATMYKWL